MDVKCFVLCVLVTNIVFRCPSGSGSAGVWQQRRLDFVYELNYAIINLELYFFLGCVFVYFFHFCTNCHIPCSYICGNIVLF